MKHEPHGRNRIRLLAMYHLQLGKSFKAISEIGAIPNMSYTPVTKFLVQQWFKNILKICNPIEFGAIFLWFYWISWFNFLNIFTDFIQLDITQWFATDNSIAVNRISLEVRYLGGGS